MPVKKKNSRAVSTDIDRYGAHNGNGPDLFEELNLSEAQFDELEQHALKTWRGIGKRKRGMSDQAQNKPRKRRAIKEHDVVASPQASYGSDPFEGVTDSQLDNLENPSRDIARERYLDKDSLASGENLGASERSTPHHSPRRRGGNDIQSEPSLDVAQNANDENELEYTAINKGVQPEFNVNITASMPLWGIKQVRQDVRVKKPPQRVNRLQGVPKTGTKATDTWPPHDDLGVYSHEFKVTRADYKKRLLKIGLSGNHAYEIDKGRYDRYPSPDLVPFMAQKEEVLFDLKCRLLLPSNAYVLVGKDGGKPLYYAVDQFHFSRITPAERNLLGFNDTFVSMTNIATTRLSDVFKNNFSKLSSDEMDDLVARRSKRITEKFAKIEFLIQKGNESDKFRNDKPATFFKKKPGELSVEDKERLLEDNARRFPINNDLFKGRRSQDPTLLGASVLEALGLNESLIGNARLGWPLLLDASKNGEIFSDGRASRPAMSGRCLLVSTESSPTYYPLNTHQSRQFSKRDLLHLGFVPYWTRTLSPIERYQFGLLPPGSEALRDALKHDPNFAQYLGNPRVQNAARATGENVASNSRDRAVERSRSSGR